MMFWKDLVEIIEAVATTGALVVAGLWTYFLFVRKRLKYPRVSLGITVDEVLLTGEGWIVHVEVKIQNTSDVMVTSSRAELRFRQVVPVPDDLRGCVQANRDPVPAGRTEIQWPLIAGREWNFDKASFQVEPGESDSLHADFMIKDDIEVAQFYFFLSNVAKSDTGLGWTLTKMYKFNKREEEDRMGGGKRKSKDRVTEQQKQQRQQVQQQQQQQQQKPKQQPKK